MKKVLEGIRVLDFGRFIAAPYCGMMLADLGAEVIRVDRPGGEEDRTIGLRASNGENMSFPSYGRNKKGITLDVFKKDGSREVLEDLVRTTDVFLHNFSPGALKAFKLNYDDMKAIKPDVIYAGISCYGATGPYADRTGFDQIAQTFSGAAAVTGFADNPPTRSALPWVDYSTGLCATIGILIALRHRDATGEGQAVDCALLQTAVSFMAPMIAEAEVLGRERPRIGNRSPYMGPTDLYKCKDGYVYVATIMEGQWRNLMKIVGQDALLDDPDLGTTLKRFEHRERIDPFVEQWMESRTVEEVVPIMDEARIPCGIYHTTKEVAADPHVQGRAMLERCNLGVPGLENVPISGMPIKLSGTPGSIEHRAPRVGEHNDDYYRDLLGYDDKRIASLTDKGII
jgi:crotonobetainyl-CoA:carnitine CoA-transferase CaiB-like acyl-CoA transferase